MIARNGTAGVRSSAARDREDAVVERLHTLAPHLDGEPDAAFRAATRARLVAMAAVRTPQPERVAPLRRLLTARRAGSPVAPWRTRLTAGLAGAALTVTGLSAMVALSTDARPGDVLYGLKRGTEQTQLALAGDSRGRTLLDFASTRLGELEYLVSEDAVALPSSTAPTGPRVVLAAGADPRLVIETLDTMNAQTTDGAAWMDERAVTTRDAGSLDDLVGWAAGQSAGLAALEPDVPEGARAAFDESLGLLADVTSRATGLRSALDCASGPATDGSDRLGPVPGTCTAGPADPPATGGDPGGSTGTGGTSGGASPTGTSTEPASPTGSAGGSVPGGETPGGGLPGGGLPGGDPTGDDPTDGDPTDGVPGPGLPTPSVPLPSTGVPPSLPPLPTGSLPSLPVPTLPLPGTPSTSLPPVDLDPGVCLGPLGIGTC